MIDHPEATQGYGVTVYFECKGTINCPEETQGYSVTVQFECKRIMNCPEVTQGYSVHYSWNIRGHAINCPEAVQKQIS